MKHTYQLVQNCRGFQFYLKMYTILAHVVLKDFHLG